MTKDALKKLKSKLRTGDRRLIAEKSGKHISTVDQVLRGEFTNTEVIEAAISVVEEHELKSQELESKIQSL